MSVEHLAFELKIEFDGETVYHCVQNDDEREVLVDKFGVNHKLEVNAEQLKRQFNE